MTKEPAYTDPFWLQLDTDGEASVRDGLLNHKWGEGGNRKAKAKEWLLQQERSRTSAFMAEQIEIARSAKDAALDAASAASRAADAASRAADTAERAFAASERGNQKSNKIAIVALIIAAIAALAQIIGAFIGQSPPHP